MGESETAEALLRDAITKEMRVRDFYLRVSARIRNRKGARLIHHLAKEEAHHARLLAGRLLELYGVSVTPAVSGPAPDDDKTKIAEQETMDQAWTLQVVSTGVDFEQDSVRFYTAELERATARPVRELLQKLVRIEERHERKLRHERDRLARDPYWLI